VHVEDASGIVPNDVGGNETEIAGEHDHVGVVLAQDVLESCAIGVPISGQHRRGNLPVTRSLERASVRTVRCHDHHVTAAAVAQPIEVFENGLEVGAAS
jgi:hypothetical protein